MEYIYSAGITLLTGILGYVLKDKIKQLRELKEEKERLENLEEDAIREGLLALLRVKLIEYHARYVNESEISTHAFENWELMFKAYTKLGGNGMVKRMNEEVKELHLK